VRRLASGDDAHQLDGATDDIADEVENEAFRRTGCDVQFGDGSGGRGAGVTAIIPLTAGDTLTVDVGGQGGEQARDAVVEHHQLARCVVGRSGLRTEIRTKAKAHRLLSSPECMVDASARHAREETNIDAHEFKTS